MREKNRTDRFIINIITSQLRAKIANIHKLRDSALRSFAVIEAAEKLNPGLSCIPTRRAITYEYRLSTCTFSLWKEHCNVGTDAEFQRVKLDENVNESIASDMKNSNPIITKSLSSGA